MKHKCEVCGKVIQPEQLVEGAPIMMCPACTEEEVRRVIREMEDHRREIIDIQRWLYDITGKAIILGSSIPVTEVMVYDGMKELAETLGEEITVIEMDDDNAFDWEFLFDHDGILYHTYGRATDRGDREIAEAWAAKHSEFQ